jgi:hypothetical protein
VPLVVEDGSLISGAVTYVTVSEVRDFAAARGITNLPEPDSGVEALIIRAMDYLENLEQRFQGGRVSVDQPLAWPRGGVVIHGHPVAENVIPQALKNAQCQLALDAQSIDLTPNGTGREVIRQKVDVIETQYAPTGSGSVLPQLNKATAYLEPLFRTTLSMFARVTRV